MSAIQELELKVLALPIEQRVLLAESLLGSLPPVGGDMSEAEELAEAERRDREIENGSVQALNDADLWRRVDANRQR